MAYDEALAERIRELVAKEKGLSEKKMFGGLAFLVGGNMAIAASGQGGILVRVDPAQSEKLVATTKASVAVMRGRAMPGWLRVDSADCAHEAAAVQVGHARHGVRPLAAGQGLSPAQGVGALPASRALISIIGAVPFTPYWASIRPDSPRCDHMVAAKLCASLA